MNTTTKKQPLVSLNSLTPEQKKQLLKELEQEQAQAEESKRASREAYKDLVSDTVTRLFPELQRVSEALAKVKKLAYDEMQTLVNLKAELYNRNQDQFTHTFTCEDGRISITIGFRVIDGWDDTVNVGIAKVDDFLTALAANKDQDTQRLINTIHRLLSKDAQGNLKASRVMELQKIAKDFNSPILNEAIEIIGESYKPRKTKRFVSCTYRDEQNAEILLPLNITDAEFSS